MKRISILEYKKKFLTLMAFTAFSLFTFSANAAGLKTSRTVLNNGLTVVVTEMPTSPMVSVYALAKTGSATEGKFLGTGISHYLEHMLFKGTTNRKVGEIAAQVQAVGGTINASTGKDHTIYTVNVPYESFDLALDIISDIMMNASFDPVEMEKERQVVISEMRMHRDHPQRYLSDLIFQTVYLQHPYRHPVIGYQPLFEKITRDDLLEYYHYFYIPNNMVLSVAGNVNIDEVLPKIEKAFAVYPRQRDITRNLTPEPDQISPRRVEEGYPTEITYASMSFQTVGLLDHDLYALDVLAKILGQGESSRLYKEIYTKKKLVYEISSSHYTPTDKGLFEVDFNCDYKDVDLVIPLVFAQLDAIKKKGVTGGELAKAKRQVESEYVFSKQTSSGIASSQAMDQAFTGDYEFSKKYIDGVSQVTNDDIKRVAGKYLLERSLSTVIVKPKEEQQENLLKESAGTPAEIKRFQLKNGMIILLRADHSLPIVNIRVVFGGGTRQETPEDNGISRIMSLLWEKGSRKYPSERLSELMESLGMGLGSFSGKNSFGVTMNFLKQDSDTALDILEDLIKNPAFPENELPQIKENLQIGLKQRDTDVNQSTSFNLRRTLFSESPFRFDDSGTKESIEGITHWQIVNYYKTYVSANNMVLSVFGDIDPDKVIKELEDRFQTLGQHAVFLQLHQEPALTSSKESTFSLPVEQAVIMAGFHGPAINSQDRYGVEVLSAILGSPFSGRLFNHIREEFGKAYRLGGDYLPSLDVGLIYFYVATKDEYADKVKELLMKEIRDLQTQDVPEQELKDIKSFLKGTNKADLQTSSSLAFTCSLDELYGFGFDNYQKYDAGIDQVTREQVKALAQKYLDLNKVSIVVTKPQTQPSN